MTGPVLNVMMARGRGGLEQAALDWHEGLRAQGLRVTSAGRSGGWFMERCPADERASLATWGRFDPFIRGRLRRAAGGHGCALLHGNRAMALLAQPVAGLRRVGVVHNFRYKPLVAKMDALIAVSHGVAEALRRDHPQIPCLVVPNLVRAPATVERPTGEAMSQIVSLGRLHENKDFGLLIRAFAQLRRSGVEVRLTIGGDGPQLGDLQALAAREGVADSVSFPGWIADRTAFFAQADLFVLSSKVEPFGIVVIEAMSHGVPVVATRTAGPLDIVSPGETGVVVACENVEEMRAALFDLLKHPDQARRLGAQGRASVLERWSFEVVAQRMAQAVDAPTT
jgi:glycosyltransferase involved in cell wall biosynthesis